MSAMAFQYISAGKSRRLATNPMMVTMTTERISAIWETVKGVLAMH